MKEKFTIEIRRYLLNRIIDETVEERLTKHNYFLRLESDKAEIMGREPLKNPVTHLEQQVVQVCTFRMKSSLELSLALKLIKDEYHPIVAHGEHMWVHLYGLTRFGRIFRRLPAFLQKFIIVLAVSSQRLSKTTTKYKWIAGFMSFATLAAKVWQSGAIDKAWIAISAFTGLLIVSLLSLWE